MRSTRPDNQAKAEIWSLYQARTPKRVPMRLNTNARVYLMNPQLNRQGITFQQAATDPRTHVQVALEHRRYLHETLHHYCDFPTGLPDAWEIYLNVYNVYEAAGLGAPVEFTANQVPATEPILTAENRREIFDRDIYHPLEHGFHYECLAFWRQMDDICRDMKFLDRPIKLLPFAALWTDGPFTVACNLRGTDFLYDMFEDPEYADQLLAFLTEAAIQRRAAYIRYWGDRVTPFNGMADDSCAMLSPEMYVERILPHHRRFLDTGVPGPRGMHLCGNSSHLFGIIHRELNVTAFDTGFPLDHGKVRRELGPDVEIAGGPPVDLLVNASPDAVYQRTKDILLSGVKEGGRFILEEGNNLPPGVPLENLDAMYQACLDHGWY